MLVWGVVYTPAPQGRSHFGRTPFPARAAFGCGRAGATLEGHLVRQVGWMGNVREGHAVLVRYMETVYSLPQVSSYRGWERARKTVPTSTFVPREICRSLTLWYMS